HDTFDMPMDVERYNGRIVGRYALFEPIASGETATVHVGRMIGPIGFLRTVAIKQLHRAYTADADLLASFVEEARLGSRIHHSNVVDTLDVARVDDEVLIVMEYVEGESLSQLLKILRASDATAPLDVAATLVVSALQGLHAVHEANDEHGQPLSI